MLYICKTICYTYNMENRTVTISKKFDGLNFAYLVNEPKLGITNNEKH